MSVQEVADSFGVTFSTISRWIKDGYIKAERRPVKPGLRKLQYFISSSEIARLKAGG